MQLFVQHLLQLSLHKQQERIPDDRLLLLSTNPENTNIMTVSIAIMIKPKKRQIICNDHLSLKFLDDNFQKSTLFDEFNSVMTSPFLMDTSLGDFSV